MPAKALDAYRETEKNTLDGRDLEAMVLSKAAGYLLEVRNNWEQPGRRELLDEALRYNQRLWTLFQVELADENNPLPVDVRRNLLQLSMFIDKRTFECMAMPDPEKLDVLISIDQNIAAGLRGAQDAAMAA